MALGAGETTAMRMTAAYATIANGGRKINATLVDRIQDRFGRTSYKHDQRECQRGSEHRFKQRRAVAASASP